jgi:hypothetical protein
MGFPDRKSCRECPDEPGARYGKALASSTVKIA